MAVRHIFAALLATAIIVEGFVLPRTAHHNVHNVLRATKDNDPERQRTLDEAKRIRHPSSGSGCRAVASWSPLSRSVKSPSRGVGGRRRRW